VDPLAPDGSRADPGRVRPCSPRAPGQVLLSVLWRATVSQRRAASGAAGAPGCTRWHGQPSFRSRSTVAPSASGGASGVCLVRCRLCRHGWCGRLDTVPRIGVEAGSGPLPPERPHPADERLSNPEETCIFRVYGRASVCLTDLDELRYGGAGTRSRCGGCTRTRSGARAGGLGGLPAPQAQRGR
jgi:hypothetical protein